MSSGAHAIAAGFPFPPGEMRQQQKHGRVCVALCAGAGMRPQQGRRMSCFSLNYSVFCWFADYHRSIFFCFVIFLSISPRPSRRRHPNHASLHTTPTSHPQPHAHCLRSRWLQQLLLLRRPQYPREPGDPRASVLLQHFLERNNQGGSTVQFLQGNSQDRKEVCVDELYFPSLFVFRGARAALSRSLVYLLVIFFRVFVRPGRNPSP